MRFTKPPKTFAEQVELLVSRGMEIDDPERAERYLSHLNYYRLAAYWLPCEQGHPTHRFRQGTRFKTPFLNITSSIGNCGCWSWTPLSGLRSPCAPVGPTTFPMPMAPTPILTAVFLNRGAGLIQLMCRT